MTNNRPHRERFARRFGQKPLRYAASEYETSLCEWHNSNPPRPVKQNEPIEAVTKLNAQSQAQEPSKKDAATAITVNAQRTVESSVTFVSPSRHTQEECHRVTRRCQYHAARTTQDTLCSVCFNVLAHHPHKQDPSSCTQTRFLGHPPRSLVTISTEL
jgi:transcription initiation factor TFIID subunit TAF12